MTFDSSFRNSGAARAIVVMVIVVISVVMIAIVVVIIVIINVRIIIIVVIVNVGNSAITKCHSRNTAVTIVYEQRVCNCMVALRVMQQRHAHNPYITQYNPKP